MELLQNSVQAYAWGSRHAIAELAGRPTPSPGPEAELWLGAHPVAPSRVVRQGASVALDEWIASRPEQTLGPRVLASFGPKLPFLLKLLAADEPLSLQAHPSRERAREGFEAEELRGIARDARERCYRDPNHKPELLCALTPFHALCGFRAAEETRELFAALGRSELDAVSSALSRGIREAFTLLLALDPEERARLVEATLDGAARIASGRFAAETKWALRLGELYPGDVGVVGALMLNLVELSPGEAIYLPAGNLHAYLGGVGVEIMASSDNVLRGGLTPKHVDPVELARVLDFVPHAVQVLRPRGGGAEQIYDTPAEEFVLSRVTLGPPASFATEIDGPEILLCLEGDVTATTRGGAPLALAKGGSAFVSADDASYVLSGRGVVYRARVPARVSDI